MPYFAIRRHILVMAARQHLKHNKLIYKRLHAREQNMMFFVLLPAKGNPWFATGKKMLKTLRKRVFIFALKASKDIAGTTACTAHGNAQHKG